MARAGILYSDVAKAATKLIGKEGKNPTVDSVRDALGGTGSKSTIAPFLRRWKAEHQGEIAQAEAGLPPTLLVAVKGLHQHMQAEFAEQLDQAKQQQAEALRAAAEREQQLRTELDTVLATTAALKDELASTREVLSQLQEATTPSVALATAQADNAGLQQRLADRAAETAALDRQLSQARTQFEHYQEATATQRTEERQGYEQRIARFEQNLATADRQIASQQADTWPTGSAPRALGRRPSAMATGRARRAGKNWSRCARNGNVWRCALRRQQQRGNTWPLKWRQYRRNWPTPGWP